MKKIKGTWLTPLIGKTSLGPEAFATTSGNIVLDWRFDGHQSKTKQLERTQTLSEEVG